MEAAVNAHNLGCKIVPWVDKAELAGDRGVLSLSWMVQRMMEEHGSHNNKRSLHPACLSFLVRPNRSS